MHLRGGYELRAPAPHDVDAVADVLIADDLDDAGQTDFDADFMQNEWSRMGFDLATSSVAPSPRSLVVGSGGGC